MDVVDVTLVGEGLVPAARVVHVHVPDVLEVLPGGFRLVHVVLVNVVNVAVVQEVDVVTVRHRGVATEPVVHVRVGIGRTVSRGVGHQHLRPAR
ncbi:MAG TPA: hypothetical protein VLM76_15545 [Patescibacteria group bacterium]|nr:hypothetical protein [Patescibacteria group bacterium]